MSLLLIASVSAVLLVIAYTTYGRVLARLLRLDPNATTPAVELRDDVDYAPIEPQLLLGQHFSAIAAAGPIVGPIMAGVAFGWAPALLWILIGSIFLGGVHDITALVASIRHKARSIAEIVRDHMNKRCYLMFLAFVWISLVYIIVAFTDVTASSFVGKVRLDAEDSTSTAAIAGQESTVPAAKPATEPVSENFVVSGGGIATSSLLYLALPIMMGLLMRYTKVSIGLATVIFLPLVGVSIWAGQHIPFDVGALFHLDDTKAQKAWDVALLIYCFIASIIPMWLLLQPRGHLGGYFMYAALAAGFLGIVFGNETVKYPAFIGWQSAKGLPLFPMLFIMIACGACSGFHSIIASGTTCKQLRKETDAKLIGYGSMLLEAMVAIISLSCVMMLSADSSLKDREPNFLYASGVGRFLSVINVPMIFGVSFGLMAFTTFVYDTLDVCTRLGRYILQELFAWHGVTGRIVATAITAIVPLVFLINLPVDPETGKLIPAWKVYWNLFGASNQLLAALSLLGVTVWLWRTRREKWVWFVTGLPTLWMYAMSMWALSLTILAGFESISKGKSISTVTIVASVLVLLGMLMLIEAILILGRRSPPSGSEPERVFRAVPAT